MNNTLKHLFLIVFIIQGIFIFRINAQTTGSLFLLPDNFQSQMVNPAFMRNDATVVIAIPGFAGGTFGNTGNFKFTDIIRRQPNNEMAFDIEHFYNQGVATTKLVDWSSIPYFYVSFPAKEGRLSFYFKEQISTSIQFRTKAIEFFNTGNQYEQYKSFYTDQAQVNASAYREFAVGYATNKTDRLSVGIRGKLLVGVIMGDLRNWEYGIKTSDDGENVELISTGMGRLSLPFETKTRNGKISEINTEKAFSKYMRAFQNPGLAMDFGLNYWFDENSQFSVSVSDLGAIWFHHNAFDINQQSSFNFKGFDLTNTLDNNRTGEYVDSYDLVLYTKDSIRSAFRFDADTARFVKALPPKTVLHYQYNFSDEFAIGVTNQTVFFRQNILNTLSVSSRQIVGSFSIFENVNLNGIDNVSIGGGFQWESSNVQFFLATDNFLAIYHPAKQKTFTVSGGLSFLFNNSENKKRRKGKFTIHLPFFEQKEKLIN